MTIILSSSSSSLFALYSNLIKWRWWWKLIIIERFVFVKPSFSSSSSFTFLLLLSILSFAFLIKDEEEEDDDGDGDDAIALMGCVWCGSMSVVDDDEMMRKSKKDEGNWDVVKSWVADNPYNNNIFLFTTLRRSHNLQTKMSSKPRHLRTFFISHNRKKEWIKEDEKMLTDDDDDDDDYLDYHDDHQ